MALLDRLWNSVGQLQESPPPQSVQGDAMPATVASVTEIDWEIEPQSECERAIRAACTGRGASRVKKSSCSDGCRLASGSSINRLCWGIRYCHIERRYKLHEPTPQFADIKWLAVNGCLQARPA
jgi:hypothetical protein